MSKLKPIYSLIVLVCLQFALSGQDVVINELMAKNESWFQDADGDFPDWIELYNPTNQTINLEDWSISDDPNDIRKWTFPDVNIEANAFIILFASDKDIVYPQELHTNFKLSSEGEIIYLYNRQEGLVDQLEFPNTDINHSFGRHINEKIIFKFPTPNASNRLSSNLECLQNSGFYNFPLDLEFTDNLSQGEYKYSLGAKPINNASDDFDSEILLENQDQENYFSNIITSPEQSLIPYPAWNKPQSLIPKCEIVTYAAYQEMEQISTIEKHSYFDNEDFPNQLSIPIISIISEEEDLFSFEQGIYVPGVNYDINNPEWSGNYYQKGMDWERKVRFEYFDTDKKLKISQDVGLRIHGGLTRCSAQKSLRIYAREKYGKKYLEEKFFEDSETTNFKNIVLRTSMASWRNDLIFKDALIHQLANGLDLDHQLQRAVMVYLNGEYWGVHFLTERIDDHYIASKHDLDVDSIEMFDWANPSFFELLNYAKENDLSIPKNYDYVARLLDIDAFIDYLWTQVYFGNVDWPFNNFTAWRPKHKNGKWRFILFDTDASFYQAENNNLEYLALEDGPEWEYDPFISIIFNALVKNENFESKFINRYGFLIENNFSKNNVIRQIKNLQTLISYHLEDHILRWNFPESRSTWLNSIESDLVDFAIKRPCIMYDHLARFSDKDDLGFACEFSTNEEIRLTLLPNPGNGLLSVEIENQTYEYVDLNIYNSLGKRILTQKDLDSIYKIEIDLSKYQSGTYFLEFYNDSFRQTMKYILIK